MGNFYCNFTLRGPSADDIVRVLNEHARTAFVTRTVNGNTVVFDEVADELDDNEVDAIGTLLSRELACPALAVAVADDDELLLRLYEDGDRRIDYSSRGANQGAYRLCRAFGRSWLAPLVWMLLQWPYLVFETFRHALLAKVLGIPQWCVGTGFRDIEQDDAPPGLERSELRRTGDGA